MILYFPKPKQRGYKMSVCKKILLLTISAVLAGCATETPYGHGDVMVGKKAIFRHKASPMKKLDCTECHDKLYTDIKHHEKHNMEQIELGDSCGTCHNGKRAFSVTGNCNRCHRKHNDSSSIL
jgi:c(7)-type cytochrome triheme protein